MGDKTQRKATVIFALLLALLIPAPAGAASDPYPYLSTGDELPGTRVWSTDETSWAQFANTTYRAGWACPKIETPNGDPYAWDGNGFDQAVGKWWRACFKNPWRSYDKAAWDKYYEDLTAAQKAAEEESRAWNAANPGRQKCVQWGPITDPYGGVSSGGVCANPVPAGTAPSGSPSVESPSVGEGDLASSVSSGSSVSSSSSTSIGLAPDPTPTGSLDYRGSGYPFTVTVRGQVGISGCPTGFQAANGLIVDVGTGFTYTECWPERAWTAWRLGGDAWELFKATGGTYDPSLELERLSKVELLKAKAKSVAEAAAQETPGIERCSSWSGFGESGKECAYAFLAPSSSSATADSSSTSSQTVVVVVSSSPSVSGVVESSSSLTVSSFISVALDTVQVSGTSLQVARSALSITPDPVEAQSISALAEGFTGLRTIQRSLLQEIPRDPTLTYRVTTNTPGVCQASSWRVRITRPGLCLLNVEITDSSGNSYEIVKRMRRVF